MEYYLAIKKNKILPSATTLMGLEGILLNEIIHTEKDKYHIISLIWEIKKVKQMNKQNRNRDTESTLAAARGEESGEMSEIGERY